MGMQFGILVAEMRWPQLMRHVEARTDRFVDRGEGEDLNRINWRNDDGLVLIAGELEDKVYLLDTSFLLSGMEPDFVAALAADSGALVIGCGAETVSGSYYFIAARGHDLLRHYYHCHMDLTQPYEWGDPLPTEEDYPFNGDLYGVGLKEALWHFGFDYDRWYDQGQRREVLYTADHLFQEPRVPLGQGPLGQALERHREQWQLAPGQRPRPTVVVSSAPPPRERVSHHSDGSGSRAESPRIRVTRVGRVETSESWLGRVVGRVREWFGG